MDEKRPLRKDIVEAWARFIDHAYTIEDLTLILDSLKGDDYLQEFDEVSYSVRNDAFVNKPRLTAAQKKAYKKEAAQLLATYANRKEPAADKMDIHHIRRFGTIRRITYSAVAVAASIALFFVARTFFIRHNSNDMMTFVSALTDSVSHSGEIQLIVSEQKTLYLQGQETVITYDSAGIHTDAAKLSKDEASSYNRLIVPYGKSSVLTLHDDTKIWVNAGTILVYPVEFEKDKREIYVNGEIFLDVAPDAKRPFTVRTDDYRIQVVGTKFNVQAYSADGQNRIALAEGAVKIISGKANTVTLTPNQVFEQDKSGRSSVKDADISRYTSWIHGMYMYESERLDVILKRLERYYGKEIEAEVSVSEITCSGELDLKENIEDVLSVISAAASVEYVKDGEKYTISYHPKNTLPMEKKR